MKIGQAIKVCRVKRGYTQEKLAGLANLSISHLCLLENDKREPSLSKIEDIANALKIPVGVLVLLGSERGEVSELSDEQLRKLTTSVLSLLDATFPESTEV